MRVLETDLAEHPENAGGHLLLGEWFHAKKNYRGAIQHLEAAARVDSELSDPHYNLGDVNYELALLDMVMRERYTQHPNGFLLFAPDEPAKQIFRKAIDEYNAAKSLKKSFREPGPEGATVAYSNPDRARERLRQASIYVSDARQESMLMWDQMHAAGETALTGREKIFEVRRTEDDLSFLRNYLTPELVQRIAEMQCDDRFRRCSMACEGRKEACLVKRKALREQLGNTTDLAAKSVLEQRLERLRCFRRFRRCDWRRSQGSNVLPKKEDRCRRRRRPARPSRPPPAHPRQAPFRARHFSARSTGVGADFLARA
jgi:tetratricopeptide (TPR) repeat protein